MDTCRDVELKYLLLYAGSRKNLSHQGSKLMYFLSCSRGNNNYFISHLQQKTITNMAQENKK